MKQQGVIPNVITYSALISACEKANQLEWAFRLFQAMKKQSIVPNTVTYSALISACEKVNLFEYWAIEY